MEEKQMKLEYIEKYPKLQDYENSIDNMLDLAKKINPSMKLYKYRSGIYNDDGTNYDLQNLKNNKIRVTNIRNFNDPFECKFVCSQMVNSLNEELDKFKSFFDITKKNKQEYIDKAHNKLIEGTDKSFLNDLLICSFSECNDNILMWSHYSNCHKGFCIEYDFSQLITFGALILPVIYSKKVPDIDDMSLDNAKRYSRIYTKSLDWEYEKEWRFILNGNSEGENFKFNKPKSIYLGCNIDENLKKDLMMICKSKDIKCYKAKKDPYEYKINFEEVLIK